MSNAGAKILSGIAEVILDSVMRKIINVDTEQGLL